MGDTGNPKVTCKIGAGGKLFLFWEAKPLLPWQQLSAKLSFAVIGDAIPSPLWKEVVSREAGQRRRGKPPSILLRNEMIIEMPILNNRKERPFLRSHKCAILRAVPLRADTRNKPDVILSPFTQ